MDATAKKPEKVEIKLTSDNIYARSEIKDGSSYLTNASISPDGERVVVTTRGEVFNLPVEKGVTKILPVRPDSMTVKPNGRLMENILFIFRIVRAKQNFTFRMPLVVNLFN